MVYVTKVSKRNGKIEKFEKHKIQNAIRKSFDESLEGNKFIAKRVTNHIVEKLSRIYHSSIPEVEEIQDIVEETLMELSFKKTAKLYILYREQRAQERGYSLYYDSTDDPYM